MSAVIKYNIMKKKWSKTGTKTFVALFYFKLANQTQQSFFNSTVDMFTLDVTNLKLRIIIIILPTDWPKIIFTTDNATKN